MRLLFIKLVAVMLSFLAILILIELIFQVLPVVSNMNTEPVNLNDQYRHFKKNKIYQYSRGYDFQIKQKKKTNNYGFMSDTLYQKSNQNENKKDLIMVIGDSYVEAMQVKNSEAFHGVMQNYLKKDFRVYSLGYSGAPLSQYVAYSKFSKQEFGANKLVISIVGNDFDESLMSVRPNPGFFYYNDYVKNNKYPLKLVEFEDIGLRSLFKSSATLRYFFLTVGLDWTHIALKLKLPFVEKQEFSGNTSSNSNQNRIEKSKKVVDNFLNDIIDYSGLDPKDIIFVVDSDRKKLYSENLSNKISFWEIMRNYFITNSIKANFKVIDMKPVFSTHYKNFGQKFEFSNDSHWNELAHSLVAVEVVNIISRSQ